MQAGRLHHGITKWVELVLAIPALAAAAAFRRGEPTQPLRKLTPLWRLNQLGERSTLLSPGENFRPRGLTMRLHRGKWIALLFILAGGMVAGTIWVFFFTPQSLVRWGVGVHQESVIRELANWSDEYARISDDASAVAAAGMIQYMSTYYVPGSGYRGPPEIEAALEVQRQKSINRIVEALRQYTGLDFGANGKRWAEWAERQVRHPPKH